MSQDPHDDGHHADHHAPEAPPEPKTPMWLPALGAVLFLMVGLVWALASPVPLPSGAGTGSSAAAP